MNKEELLSIEKVNFIINEYFLKNSVLYVLIEDYPKFYKYKDIENMANSRTPILELNDPFMILRTKSIFDDKNNISVWLQILKGDELFWISLIYCENDESCLETSLFLASKVIQKWEPAFYERNREKAN